MMILNAQRLADLRVGLTGPYAAEWRRLVEQCDRYRQAAPPATHPEASITYLGPAAINLALAYRLTGHRHYLDEAWRWISATIRLPHWGRAHLPDHDLDAGWLLHGLSLAYSWIGDELAAADEAELRAKLELQGTRLYAYAVETEGGWWSSSYWQNHNWICLTGLAAAGYALGRADWTDRVKLNFERVVDLLNDDGSDSEGVVYWRYGVIWIASYLDLLRDREGIDWFGRCAFLANTFSYRLHQAAPGYGEIVDHGDCHDRRSGHSVALYRKLAAEYRLGEAQWLADLVVDELYHREAYESGVKPGVLPEVWAELLWLDRTVAPVDPAARTPTTAHFPDLGLITARTGWDDGATLVSFKSSPGGGHRAWRESHRLDAEHSWDTLSAGHHHPDAGSFVLISHGAHLLVDEGYSNAKRTAHHNALLVDDHGYADEDRYHVYKGIPETRTADLTDVVIMDGFVHATARVAAMYPAELGLRRLDRTMIRFPGGRLVLRDRLAAAEPRTLTALLQADWPWQTEDDRWLVRSGSGQAWISPLTQPVTAEPVISEVRANPTSSTPSLSLARTLHTLRLSAAPSGEQTMITAIEPTSSLDPAEPTARLLDAAGGTVVIMGDDLVWFGQADQVVLVKGDRSVPVRADESVPTVEELLAVVREPADR